MSSLVAIVLSDSLGVLALYFLLQRRWTGERPDSAADARRYRLPVVVALFICAMVGFAALLLESRWFALQSTSAFLTLATAAALALLLAIGFLIVIYRMRMPQRYALTAGLGLWLTFSAYYAGSAPPEFAITWELITLLCEGLGVLLFVVAIILILRSQREARP